MLAELAGIAKKVIDDNSGCCDHSLSVAREDREPGPSALASLKTRKAPHESESNQLPTDSLQALSKRDLIALLRRKPSGFDDADVAVLRASTLQRLGVLTRRVREGHHVDEASEFARYVTASGLLKLLGTGDTGRDLRRLLGGIQRDCEAFWKNEGRGPWIAKSELEDLHGKIDKLEGLMARHFGTPAMDGTGPELVVLPPGGEAARTCDAARRSASRR